MTHSFLFFFCAMDFECEKLEVLFLKPHEDCKDSYSSGTFSIELQYRGCHVLFSKDDERKVANWLYFNVWLLYSLNNSFVS